jgi:hypothetical protein
MRHVFYSLHYDVDRERADLVRKHHELQPNPEAKPNEWATIKRTGEFAIKRWIEQQLRGRSCTIVLIGSKTAERPWVRYEIERSWELKLGLVGVHIHALKDAQGKPCAKGESPFFGELASQVRVYDPPESDSKLAYRHIADNLTRWVEHAVATRLTQP